MLAALAQVAQTVAHPPLVFKPVVPELILLGTAIVLLLMDALSPNKDQRPLALLSLAGIAGAAAYSVYLWRWTERPGHPATVLGGMVAADQFAVFFRLVLLGVAAIGVLLAYHYL